MINPSCCHRAAQTIDNFNLQTLWGVPASEFRLAVGLWSVHTSENSRRNGQNNLLGISYKGYFGGTFINSYYKRAYTVGIQRYWLMNLFLQDLNYELGYRIGLVSGYKGYNASGINSLRDSNVIPFIQFVFGLNYKNVGWEISTPNLSVISTGFYIRFY